MPLAYLPPQARDFALAFELAERERRLGHYEAALGVSRVALSQWPHYPQGWIDLSRTLFALRRWPEAWQAFGWRFEAFEGRSRPARALQPDLKNLPRLGVGGRPRELAVVCEGGPGDVILFSRFFAPMMASGVRLRVIAPRPLIPLLRTLDPAPPFRCDDEPDAGAGCDAFAPLMDLPALLQAPEADLAASKPVLRAEPERVARWRAWLAERRGDRHGPVVAVAWRDGPPSRGDADGALALADFAPLADAPGVNLLCLQGDATEDELRTCGFGQQILRPGPDLDADGAFLDSAALLTLVDRLVSVDTALAHLAGSLFTPGDILLGRDPDWRWLATEPENVWHPTLRVHRRGATETGAELVARCIASRAPAALASVA